MAVSHMGRHGQGRDVRFAGRLAPLLEEAVPRIDAVRIGPVVYQSAEQREAIAQAVATILREGDPDGLDVLLGILVQHTNDGRAILAAVLELARTAAITATKKRKARSYENPITVAPARAAARR